MLSKIAIIGVGNKLMGDDGVGIHAIEYFRSQEPFPIKNTDLLDCGTGGITLLHVLEEYESAIIIDAADFKEMPGSVKNFDLSKIKLSGDSAQVSLHGTSLAGIIHLAGQLGKKLPKIYLVLIQPKTVAPSIELTSECKNAIPKIYEMVRKISDALS